MAKIDKIKVGSTTYSILDSVTAQIVCDNEESGNTASRTYTKGEYVKINDKLYKVTANIATGQAMTVGVNITETNVGDELSQLKSDLTVIGDTVIQSGSQTNVANNSNVAIVQMPTITKGTYIVTGWLNFQSTNTTGSRCGKFASSNYSGKEAEVAPNTGGYTQMIISDIVTFDEDVSTFCLQCRQTSGSLMNVSGQVKMIRIK